MGRAAKKLDRELFFRALADGPRLRLINLMGTDEVCVCFLVEILGAGQPKFSRHLAYLRRAEIVKTRKDGKWVQYSVAEPPDPNAARVLGVVRAWLTEDTEMRRDRERIARVCCAPRFCCRNLVSAIIHSLAHSSRSRNHTLEAE